MALSVNQQAAAYSPVFSPQIFQATSTNTAQPNHSYTVVCTDVTTGISTKYQVSKDPTYSAMFFDASGFAKQFIKYFMPQYVGGFQKVAGSIRQITVNVGESYGAGTPTYYPGSNYTYIVWSGIIDFLGFAAATYDTTKYIYKIGRAHV